jgi:hypothetical protein
MPGSLQRMVRPRFIVSVPTHALTEYTNRIPRQCSNLAATPPNGDKNAESSGLAPPNIRLAAMNNRYRVERERNEAWCGEARSLSPCLEGQRRHDESDMR